MSSHTNYNERDMRLRAFMEEYALLLQVFDDVSNIRKLLTSIEFLLILLLVEILAIFCIILIGLFCYRFCCPAEPELEKPHNYGPKPAKYKQYQQTIPPTVETAILPSSGSAIQDKRSSMNSLSDKRNSLLDNIPTIIYESTA